MFDTVPVSTSLRKAEQLKSGALKVADEGPQSLMRHRAMDQINAHLKALYDVVPAQPLPAQLVDLLDQLKLPDGKKEIEPQP